VKSNDKNSLCQGDQSSKKRKKESFGNFKYNE